MEFKCHSTGELKMDEFVKLECVPTAEVRGNYQSFQEQRQYRLEARIGMYFWANDAERDTNQRAALRAIRMGIYGDILPLLARLRVAINSGSREEAHLFCDKIDTLIRKETL